VAKGIRAVICRCLRGGRRGSTSGVPRSLVVQGMGIVMAVTMEESGGSDAEALSEPPVVEKGEERLVSGYLVSGGGSLLRGRYGAGFPYRW